jgi:hypothetical protein
MTAARALITWLTSTGVTLRLDGDAIVHRGPRSVLRPDVLANLRRHKSEIVAELRFQAKTGSWPPEVNALQCRIVSELELLPPPRDHSGRRLMAETRKFLESRWWVEALTCGWTLEELFGIDSCAPIVCFERWGLVVGLALAPKRGDVIEHLDAKRAAIRYLTGTPLKNSRRTQLRFRPTETTVVWWQCSALMGQAEGPNVAGPEGEEVIKHSMHEISRRNR